MVTCCMVSIRYLTKTCAKLLLLLVVLAFGHLLCTVARSEVGFAGAICLIHQRWMLHELFRIGSKRINTLILSSQPG